MKKLTILFAVILSILSLSGCVGNNEIWDGFTNESNTFGYAMVELPNGQIYEGEIDKWADYESDAVKIRFKDGQVIVTSYNKAVLFKSIPEVR